jgi:MerR family transcriptional regulator, copper efflux regulator
MKNAGIPAGPVRIGALAAKTGCSIPTIRYYEEVGLIPPAARTESGHRVYQPAAAQLLGFIRRCRDFGFSLEQVRSLLSLAQGKKDCTEARDVAQEQLSTVRAKMLELMTLERTLAQFVDTCSATCAGGPAPKCNIIRDLGFDSSAAAGCC